MIARDSAGSVLWSPMRRCHALRPPKVAEVKALLFAARLAQNHGITHVILESNCKAWYLDSRRVSVSSPTLI